MKFRKLFATLAVVGTALVSLVACGGGKKGEISIWVGSESVDFYKATVKDYLDNNIRIDYYYYYLRGKEK